MTMKGQTCKCKTHEQTKNTSKSENATAKPKKRINSKQKGRSLLNITRSLLIAERLQESESWESEDKWAEMILLILFLPLFMKGIYVFWAAVS